MDFEFLFEPVEEPRRLAHAASSRARRCWSRSGSRSCSACATPPIPTTWSRSPRWSPPTTATPRAAVRLGAWWGLGHAAMLLAIGLPLIAFKSELPAWLESGAEKAVGVVILLLAGRVIVEVAARRLPGRPPRPRHGVRRRPRRPATATCAAASGRTTATSTCARRARRSGSASCTGSPAPARSSCS